MLCAIELGRQHRLVLSTVDDVFPILQWPHSTLTKSYRSMKAHRLEMVQREF